MCPSWQMGASGASAISARPLGRYPHRAVPVFDEGNESPARIIVEGLSLFALLAAAALAAGAARTCPHRVGRRFWRLAAPGLALLALDELLAVHEHLGRWLSDRGVPNPPGVTHLDDLIVGAIGLAGLALVLLHRSYLRATPAVLWPMAAGVGLLAGGVAWDVLGPTASTPGWYTEEALELAGFALLGLAAATAAGLLRRASPRHRVG